MDAAKDERSKEERGGCWESLGRYRPGGVYQDRTNQTRYTVVRVLQVGSNEYLIYLRPLVVHDSAVAPP